MKTVFLAYLTIIISLYSISSYAKVLEKIVITKDTTSQITEGDLNRIKHKSKLNPHEGKLSGITIRIEENHDKFRVSLDRANIVKDDDSYNDFGELRAFIATLDEDEAYQDLISEKGLYKDAYLLDAITMMRADVTRTLEKIDDDEPLPPALSGDNLHVDMLDLSLLNIMPGDIIRINDALLFATNNPHYACTKFEQRFGSLAYDFINSESEFFAQGYEYDTENFAKQDLLVDIENELNGKEQYPDLAKGRLGAFHRLRGIRLAVLRTGTIQVGDSVKIYYPNLDTKHHDWFTNPSPLREASGESEATNYRFSGNIGETLSLSYSEAKFVRNVVNGSLDPDIWKTSVNRPHKNSADHAKIIHNKQVYMREIHQRKNNEGLRR